MQEYLYVVAVRAETMETRQHVTGWLKTRGAVHVLADMWFLKTHYRMSGDVIEEIKRYVGVDGRAIVLQLNSAPTDWAHNELSEEADAWLRENLQP